MVIPEADKVKRHFVCQAIAGPRSLKWEWLQPTTLAFNYAGYPRNQGYHLSLQPARRLMKLLWLQMTLNPFDSEAAVPKEFLHTDSETPPGTSQLAKVRRREWK